jgi:hypothetical protein
MSDSVTNIWAKRGSEKSVICTPKFLKCSYSHYLGVPDIPLSIPPSQAAEKGVADILRCHFVHKDSRKVFEKIGNPYGQLSTPVLSREIVI